MRFTRVVLLGCFLVGSSGINSAFAQFGIPKLPKVGKGGKDNSGASQQQPDPRQQSRNNGPQVNPPGVPVPADSPMFEAFRKLQQQSSYHQRMTINIDDPQMQQMMAQMGFAPAETITSGDTKQVSMHFKLPVSGQVEDFELRSVSRNGRIAKKWSSPASGRILKEQDASIAKQLAQAEQQSASSIAKNLAMGPMGLVSSAVSAAGAAASVAEAAKIKKEAHDFWEWSCLDGSGPTPSQSRLEPPPLTDLKVLGDQTLEGVAVTSYEFYVKQNGKSQGPVQMHIAKDTGLPMRMAMRDPRAGGSMQMDYFGFNQAADIEVPGCLSGGK
jgi:hypothetical protein